MPERKMIAFYSPYPGAGKSTAARWMAQGVDFRDTEAYDEVQIDSIGADGDEFEIRKVEG